LFVFLQRRKNFHDYPYQTPFDIEKNITFVAIIEIVSLQERLSLPKLKSSNFQIFKFSNHQIIKSSNHQIFKSSNLQIFKSSNLQIFKFSNLQIFRSYDKSRNSGKAAQDAYQRSGFSQTANRGLRICGQDGTSVPHGNTPFSGISKPPAPLR
jgi:hypothetical protein